MICLLFISKANAFTFENNKLKIESFSKINTNETLDILFKFSLKNGWHISWQNPGDAGVPTQFNFQNAKAFFVASSVPEEFLYEEILTQYGYSNEAYYLFHLSELTKTPSLFLSWTACKDECIPEELQIDILKETSPLFEKTQKKAEKTFPKKLEKPIEATLKNGHLFLDITLDDDILSLISASPDIIPTDSKQKIIKKGKKSKVIIEDLINPVLPDEVIIRTQNQVYIAPVIQQTPHFLWLLLLAFIGGMILNLMPCVFPVLSLKALFLASSDTSFSKRFQNGALYMCGVLLSFLSICFVLYLFKKSGAYLGWGFQLQSPLFVALILVLFILILLYLWNILKIEMPFINFFTKASSLNSFLAGFFAVLIATPCTGPFMGAAIGYALFEKPSVYFPIFLSLGFGYALPFTLLELFPGFLKKILPAPGKWMERLKYILSVPILLTVIWLGWVLFHELSNSSKTDSFEPFSIQKLEESLNRGDAVFIDFTAKWCLTCLFNEKTTLDTQSFRQLSKNQNIKLFKADWTNKDSSIYEALKFYSRSSVPLYVFYPKGATKEQYTILPQILTSDILKKTMLETN